MTGLMAKRRSLLRETETIGEIPQREGWRPGTRSPIFQLGGTGQGDEPRSRLPCHPQALTPFAEVSDHLGLPYPTLSRIVEEMAAAPERARSKTDLLRLPHTSMERSFTIGQSVRTTELSSSLHVGARQSGQPDYSS